MATSRGDGAISGVTAADGHVDKPTAVSDEEAPLIHAVYPYYRIVGGTDWLHKELWGETVIARLSRAPDWLYARRFDDDHQLVKGATRADVLRRLPEWWALVLVGRCSDSRGVRDGQFRRGLGPFEDGGGRLGIACRKGIRVANAINWPGLGIPQLCQCRWHHG